MHYYSTFFWIALFFCSKIFGQNTQEIGVPDSLNNSFHSTNLYEQRLAQFFQENPLKKNTTDSLISDDQNEIKNRLSCLNEKTPFEFNCSESNILYVQKYISNREKFAQKMLAHSQLYFPFFEQQLIENDLPVELKYLPIMESALNPTAKSRAGAVGLWQFMPLTAKMMGLEINSYIDQRRDPILSTKAACEYLKKLYGIYEDWNLALAAYNAGPGNVNKAIRRSGNKKTYWEIRPFLPKETQTYVPTFTAINYLMEFTFENSTNSIPFQFFDIDTVHVRERVDFNIMEKWLSYEVEKIATLNPVYKLNIIPKTGITHALQLPTFLIGDFIMQQDSIYFYSKKNTVLNIPNKTKSTTNYYTIKEGDTIWDIAKKYDGLSVADIKKLNANIDVSKVKKGDKILIYSH